VLNSAPYGNAIYNASGAAVLITDSKAPKTAIDEANAANHTNFKYDESLFGGSGGDEPTYGYVSATGANGNAVYNAGAAGIIYIGGEREPKAIMDAIDGSEDSQLSGYTQVLSTSGAAVYNAKTGKVIINGGLVQGIEPTAVAVIAASGDVGVSNLVTVFNGLVRSNNRSDTVQGTIVLGNSGSATTTGVEARVLINGGRVDNTNQGIAIYNNSVDRVHVSGGIVTSKSVYDNQGTVVLSAISEGELTNVRFRIDGIGKVSNEASGDGVTICNLSNGVVRIMGGGVVEVTGTSGKAVYNANKGRVIFQGTDVVVPDPVNHATAIISAVGRGSFGIYNVSNRIPTTPGDESVVLRRGMIVVTSGTAVFNGNSGTVVVGEQAPDANKLVIEAGSGRAIENNADGQIVIVAGTVQATEPTGIAVWNNSYGKVRVGSRGEGYGSSTLALIEISSVNTASNRGTIYFAETLGWDKPELIITWGNITNTASTGNLIYNASQGVIRIIPTANNFNTKVGLVRPPNDPANPGTPGPGPGYIIYNTNENASFQFREDPTQTAVVGGISGTTPTISYGIINENYPQGQVIPRP